MSSFWAITSYFNPAGYRRRLRNYKIFRERLDVALVTVELSQSATFELAPGDADILIQIRGGDVMWQKERLLNVALAHLPDECAYVAWIDCDLLFAREDWVSAAIRELEGTNLCQLYETACHLRPDTPAGVIGREFASVREHSIGYATKRGLTTSAAATTDGVPGTFKRGLAWCARRELLNAHGFYDRSIIGNGDRLLAFAATGQLEDVIANLLMSPAHAEDYRRWAAGFRSDAGRLGCIGGDIFHLWHGDLRRRRYTARHQILRDFDYDPSADIALDGAGAWRWNSPKFEMHRRVSEYFNERREDGEREELISSEP